MTVKPHVVEELAREVERTHMEQVATPEERKAYRDDHERRDWRLNVLSAFELVAEEYAAEERTPQDHEISPDLIRPLINIVRNIRVGHERGLRDPDVLALALRLDDFLFVAGVSSNEDRAKRLRLDISELQEANSR